VVPNVDHRHRYFSAGARITFRDAVIIVENPVSADDAPWFNLSAALWLHVRRMICARFDSLAQAMG
jgi:hypothetical protein